MGVTSRVFVFEFSTPIDCPQIYVQRSERTEMNVKSTCYGPRHELRIGLCAEKGMAEGTLFHLPTIQFSTSADIDHPFEEILG